ncbi:hypothetical protein Ciccas_008338 [Cichlidogyrus casuarinus]|uniref:Uncharacterized protein n=1 Tax=Cichlidogyrus casuarinus TaxID=1844966 RepID=A0ABD2Q094_9PLAT
MNSSRIPRPSRYNGQVSTSILAIPRRKPFTSPVPPCTGISRPSCYSSLNNRELINHCLQTPRRRPYTSLDSYSPTEFSLKDPLVLDNDNDKDENEATFIDSTDFQHTCEPQLISTRLECVQEAVYSVPNHPSFSLETELIASPPVKECITPDMQNLPNKTADQLSSWSTSSTEELVGSTKFSENELSEKPQQLTRKFASFHDFKQLDDEDQTMDDGDQSMDREAEGQENSEQSSIIHPCIFYENEIKPIAELIEEGLKNQLLQVQEEKEKIEADLTELEQENEKLRTAMQGLPPEEWLLAKQERQAACDELQIKNEEISNLCQKLDDYRIPAQRQVSDCVTKYLKKNFANGADFE